MRKINRTDRILNFCHADLDGAVCSIIMANVFSNIHFIYTSFGKIDEYVRKVDFNAWDHIFLTDIYPNNESVLKISDKFIVIDHHDSTTDLNDPKSMRFVDKSQCAAKLLQKWMKAYFKIDLNFLNNLVELTNDYDLWIHKHPESKMLDTLYWWYKSNAFRQRFLTGNTTFNSQEIAYINQKKEEYERMYQNLNGVDFDMIKGCLIFNCDNFVNDICDDLLNKDGYKIVFFNNKSGSTSVRHNINGLHIGNLLRKFGVGGGHEKAAGALFSKDQKEYSNQIGRIIKDIYDNFPEARN